MKIQKRNPLAADIEAYLDLLKQVEVLSNELYARMKASSDTVHKHNLVQHDMLHIIESTDPEDMTPNGALDILTAIHEMREKRRTGKLLYETFGSSHKTVLDMLNLSRRLRAEMSNNLERMPKSFKPKTTRAQELHDSLRARDGHQLSIHIEETVDIRRDDTTWRGVIRDATGEILSYHENVNAATIAAAEQNLIVQPTPISVQRMNSACGGIPEYAPWVSRHRLLDPTSILSGDTRVTLRDDVWVELVHETEDRYVARSADYDIDADNRFVFIRHTTPDAVLDRLHASGVTNIIVNRALVDWTHDWIVPYDDDEKLTRQNWCGAIQRSNSDRYDATGEQYFIDEYADKIIRIVRQNDGAVFGEYPYLENAYLDAAKHDLTLVERSQIIRRLRVYAFADPVYQEWRHRHLERFGLLDEKPLMHTDNRPPDEQIVTTDGRLARDIDPESSIVSDNALSETQTSDTADAVVDNNMHKTPRID